MLDPTTKDEIEQSRTVADSVVGFVVVILQGETVELYRLITGPRLIRVLIINDA